MKKALYIIGLTILILACAAGAVITTHQNAVLDIEIASSIMGW